MKLLPHNQAMKDFLHDNGIECRAKLILKGSLKGIWRLYQPNVDFYNNAELQRKLTNLQFKDFDGKEIDKFSGHGGLFAVLLRYKGPYSFDTRDKRFLIRRLETTTDQFNSKVKKEKRICTIKPNI